MRDDSFSWLVVAIIFALLFCVCFVAGVMGGDYETALSYFALLVAIFIGYLYSRGTKARAASQKKLEEFKRKKELKEFQKKKEDLILKGYNKYIENFVKSSLYEDSEEIEKLRELLDKKGFTFDWEETISLLNEEIKAQNYKDFKVRMSYQNPQNLEGYVRSLLDIYGDNYHDYLEFLKTFLAENNLRFTEALLLCEIERVRKEMELAYFENKLSFGQPPSMLMSDLDSMSGYEFEYFLKTLFEKMGHSAEHTSLSGDQGADLVISKLGERIVVQAKNCSNKVNNKAVQEVVAAINHYGADKGMVVTNSIFTNSAVQLAKSNNIELVDRYKLQELIQKYL